MMVTLNCPLFALADLITTVPVVPEKLVETTLGLPLPVTDAETLLEANAGLSVAVSVIEKFVPFGMTLQGDALAGSWVQLE
jgi:hypothetical protein